jgi:hypothetical protein
MRRVIRSRLPVLLVSMLLLGGFGLALARSENVSVTPSGSREEHCFRGLGECPPMPRSLQESLDLGDHLGTPRTVAIVTVGELLSENPSVLGEGPPYPAPPPGLRPEELAKRPLRGPPMLIEAASTHYALRLDEVLSSQAHQSGDMVTLRVSGTRSDSPLSALDHPRKGQRLLLVLVTRPDRPYDGIYFSYHEATFDISGPKTHFADPWRTSVKEMGAPESTPAFIEAARAALAAP